MVRNLALSLLCCFVLGGISLPNQAHAGDEDVKKEKVKAEPQEPEPPPPPPINEAPDLTLGDDEEPQPSFETSTPPPAQPRRAVRERKPWDPDRNIDYSELMARVESTDPGRGVLQPAQGFRGYRPSMIALSAYDRTPGFGGLIEYSWNRIGVGVYYSYLSEVTRNANTKILSQSFVGMYGLYRWLPFDLSPLFLAGLEAGINTNEAYGGIVGAGFDLRFYYGWTLLLGYTYHSTVHRGYWGGGLGWSF